jgi:crossover junction endodeoxyribonuclease RuvC
VRVAGIDLSMDATGVSDAEGRVWTVKSAPPKPDDKDDWELRDARLKRIRQELAPIIRGHHLVVLEGPAYAAQTPGVWDRAGLWWQLYAGLRNGGFMVGVVPPTLLKRYATGKGNAGKTAVISAVTRWCPEVEIANDNEADALVLRLMGMDQLGAPLVRVPAAHRTALAGCSWPARLR